MKPDQSCWFNGSPPPPIFCHFYIIRLSGFLHFPFIPGVKDHKGQVRVMADNKDGCSGDEGDEVCPQRSSDGHRTGDDLVLQHDADHQEDKVQHEHDEAKQLAHAPLAGGDGDDDEEEHEEEKHDGTEEAVGADLHRSQPAEY